MTVNVTALLVSHDGARWLPSVLDGLERQSRLPDRLIAVENGPSAEESLRLLRERLGDDHVLPAPEQTTFAAAVRTALAAEPAQPDEWVWILHDDSRPDAGCLEALLETATSHPRASVIGPKLREWPSLRRLLELGVTISGTGVRETGLERGEYDQGQHDTVREVLAVNTAGMLVKRDLLERLGFDDQLPVVGTDLDFGWRTALSGHTTVVSPEAVVFHAEAAHRGLRSDRHAAHVLRVERESAHYVLLANASSRRLFFVGLRLLVWGLLRALGLLLLRAPGEAWDEVAALARTLGRPFRILKARSRRRGRAEVDRASIRHLFPPWWLPFRHGLDVAVDAGAAVFSAVFDFRPANRPEGWDDGEDELAVDTTLGWVTRILRSPVFIVTAVLTVVALFTSRGLWGGIPTGGALPPVFTTVSGAWDSYLESWHAIGVGSSAPAAPYLVPLAAAGALLGGHVSWAVQALLLLSVPLAGLGGLRFARRMIPSTITGVWAAITYALLPVATGAVQQGRLGTVLFVVVLPHLALSLQSLLSRTDNHSGTERRSRSLWRAALWLALAAAFAPVVLALAAVGWLVAVLLRLAVLHRLDRGLLLAGAAILVAFLLLAPWSLLTWNHAGPGSWLLEAGWRAPDLVGPQNRVDLLLGRPGVGGAPAWISVGVLLPALAVALRPALRVRAIVGWVVALVATAAAVALSYADVRLAGATTGAPVWVGTAIVLASGAVVYLAALAGAGMRTSLSGRSFGWRQPFGVALVGLAAVVPLVTAGWWINTGSGGPLTTQRFGGTPAYLVDAARHRPMDGTLRMEGSSRSGFTYLVQRGEVPGLGDEAVLPTAEAQADLTAAVQGLTTTVTDDDIERLASYGVRFIYLPPPADPELSADLDAATSMLGPSSTLRSGARAWELQIPATGSAITPETSTVRGWLIAVQLAALGLVIVLALPGRRRVS